MSPPAEKIEEMASISSQEPPPTGHNQRGKAQRWSLILMSISLMAVGNSAQILGRVYFLHGGKRLWLATLVQVCGWPIALVPLAISYIQRRRQQKDVKIFFATPRIVLACAILGVAMGLNCYLFSYGTSYLPVSTSSILASTQLGFTSFFAFFIVKQRFTPYSINSIVLLLCGAVLLGITSNGDRPKGESNVKYALGYFMTIGAAAVSGLMMPLIELTYLRIKQKITYTLVMEIQVLMAFFGTIFCIVGMIVAKDFQAIPREVKNFGLGEVNYYVVNVATAVLWQIFNLGFVSLISCSSSLLAGVVSTVLLPVVEILAVITLHEKFSGGKGLSLVISLWGFASYFYGEWKQYKKTKTTPTELELPGVP